MTADPENPAPDLLRAIRADVAAVRDRRAAARATVGQGTGAERAERDEPGGVIV